MGGISTVTTRVGVEIGVAVGILSVKAQAELANNIPLVVHAATLRKVSCDIREIFISQTYKFFSKIKQAKNKISKRKSCDREKKKKENYKHAN